MVKFSNFRNSNSLPIDYNVKYFCNPLHPLLGGRRRHSLKLLMPVKYVSVLIPSNSLWLSFPFSFTAGILLINYRSSCGVRRKTWKLFTSFVVLSSKSDCKFGYLAMIFWKQRVHTEYLAIF